MEQKKEAVYLINDERYLHLRENGAGVGFATYNKVTDADGKTIGLIICKEKNNE